MQTLLFHLLLSPYGQGFFLFLSTWWHFWLYVKCNFLFLQNWQTEDTLKLVFPLILKLFHVFLFRVPHRKCPDSVSSFPPTASVTCQCPQSVTMGFTHFSSILILVLQFRQTEIRSSRLFTSWVLRLVPSPLSQENKTWGSLWASLRCLWIA